MCDGRATGYSNIDIFRFLYKTFAKVTRQKIISQYVSLRKKKILYVSILLSEIRMMYQYIVHNSNKKKKGLVTRYRYSLCVFTNIFYHKYEIYMNLNRIFTQSVLYVLKSGKNTCAI